MIHFILSLQILQMDGNPTDACSIASYVAFQCCKIPKVTLLAGPSGSMDDFEINGDISEGIPVNISRIPILMTSILVSFIYIIHVIIYYKTNLLFVLQRLEMCL